jgi:hypothetical protein
MPCMVARGDPWFQLGMRGEDGSRVSPAPSARSEKRRSPDSSWPSVRSASLATLIIVILWSGGHCPLSPDISRHRQVSPWCPNLQAVLGADSPHLESRRVQSGLSPGGYVSDPSTPARGLHIHGAKLSESHRALISCHERPP